MNIEFIPDLAVLAKAIEQLSGKDTERLFVFIENFPVIDIYTGNTVGTFNFNQDTEDFEFRTAE